MIRDNTQHKRLSGRVSFVPSHRLSARTPIVGLARPRLIPPVDQTPTPPLTISSISRRVQFALHSRGLSWPYYDSQVSVLVVLEVARVAWERGRPVRGSPVRRRPVSWTAGLGRPVPPSPARSDRPGPQKRHLGTRGKQSGRRRGEFASPRLGGCLAATRGGGGERGTMVGKLSTRRLPSAARSVSDQLDHRDHWSLTGRCRGTIASG